MQNTPVLVNALCKHQADTCQLKKTMQYLELLRWPYAGGLTINDEPLLTVSDLRIYELISHFEHIDVRANGKFIARYKHLALQGNCVFVYDFAAKECKGSLGEFQLYKISARGELQLIA